MFANCTSLTDVTINSDMSNTHIFYRMFYNCSSLVSATNLKDSNMQPISNGVTNRSVKEMFRNCSSLTDISILNGADMTECGTFQNMLNGCTSLSNQTLADVIKTWTFSTDAPFITTGDNNSRSMSKTGFPAGWYDCANGRVYIESGGRIRQNGFEPNP